ncbi:Hypothetical predicted protein, partial [Pelobates cultripes]
DILGRGPTGEHLQGAIHTAPSTPGHPKKGRPGLKRNQRLWAAGAGPLHGLGREGDPPISASHHAPGVTPNAWYPHTSPGHWLIKDTKIGGGLHPAASSHGLYCSAEIPLGLSILPTTNPAYIACTLLY